MLFQETEYGMNEEEVFNSVFADAAFEPAERAELDDYVLAEQNPYRDELDPYRKGVQFFQVRQRKEKK